MVDAFFLHETDGTGADIETLQRDEEEQKPEKALFCKSCGRLITYAEHAVEVDDSHHHTFFNPAGIIYEIRCFSSAEGCATARDASSEFTWFAGFVWRVAFCAGCSVHIGWHFS